MGTTAIQDALAEHKKDILELIDYWLDRYLDGKISYARLVKRLQGLRW